MDFAVPADHRVNIKESKKIDKHLDLARELKKNVEYVGDGDTNCSLCTGNTPQSIRKRIGTGGNWRKNQDHSDNTIDEISLNIQKSLRNLGRLAVTQNSGKDHKLMWL